jgi:putative tryptophan/tyrosine transport system substrate-binding protein
MLRKGLSETGYIEGRNIAFEYRWAEGDYHRLPGLAADLVSRNVTVIVSAGGIPTTLAAKAATATIPIVFIVGLDPVELGIVASFNRPGGNATGVSILNNELAPKLLELLHELLPKDTVVGFLINPNNASGANLSRQMQTAGETMGQQVHVVNASNEGEFEQAFATLAQVGARALVVSGDPFFNARPKQLVAMAAHHSLPTIYPFRDYAVVGGLMSYGTKLIRCVPSVG